ncbi:MAG: hypothetical protein JRM86_04455 [Nitrososphaerota archaeon]|nr:hypothetical protein [Nitrososphaerota archaeon]MDG6978845.1 hypothetical protein [Nitrososphaerota archaeon]MDG7006164.1 hypothetical protein [Nitrososphaerota archaeon]
MSSMMAGGAPGSVPNPVSMPPSPSPNHHTNASHPNAKTNVPLLERAASSPSAAARLAETSRAFPRTGLDTVNSAKGLSVTASWAGR